MLEKFSIQAYITNIDILRQTVEQIKKDFDLFGMEIKFSGNNYDAYEELFNQIQPHIEQLIQKDYQRFMNILYRIDVNEQQLKQKLHENSSESTGEIISDLIIKRELQKVVIRNYYKQHGK